MGEERGEAGSVLEFGKKKKRGRWEGAKNLGRMNHPRKTGAERTGGSGEKEKPHKKSKIEKEKARRKEEKNQLQKSKTPRIRDRQNHGSKNAKIKPGGSNRLTGTVGNPGRQKKELCPEHPASRQHGLKSK